MIAGGKERQLKFLENSPTPNKSEYFSNEFTIELQDVFVTDEVHIHYRDFRIALDRVRFKQMAKGFAESLTELENFEKTQSYDREHHPDRLIEDFNTNKSVSNYEAKTMGVTPTRISQITSPWLEGKGPKWQANRDSINSITASIKEGIKSPPIILSTENDGSHYIIDGHHRFEAHKQLKLNTIDAIVTDITFKESEKIRKAEHLLKEFDIETNFKYSLCSFMKSYLGFRLNRFYTSAFKRKMKRQTWWWRTLRWIKIRLFGKGFVFKTFNESHNHHN
ncbi:ParB/RepB/Spo0J family partition protein [Pelagicoccus mobilis]